MAFQEDALFPLTVAGNVGYGLRLQGRSRAAAREEALRVLNLVGLASSPTTTRRSLRGMRQRVALARLLANRPAPC